MARGSLATLGMTAQHCHPEGAKRLRDLLAIIWKCQKKVVPLYRRNVSKMQIVFKHIATTITLICFLTATNGLNLIEHRCSTKNQSFLFLLSQNASCDVDCCLEDACCSEVLDCCENINHFTQLDADFFSTQHDFKTETCPIFYLSHLFFAPPATCPHCGTLHCADFLGNAGVPVQLRIKQTTEFLL